MQSRPRRRTGPPLDPAARQVIEAAAILEISEYELLDLAYREWFGRPPRPAALNDAFGPYMFHGRTPFWAVALAREIIALDDAGRLAGSRFRAALKPPPTLRELVTAAGQSALLLLLFGLIWYAATHTPYPYP
ncbi:MAG: hypothetical protein R3225_09960 [Halofilum sp. (in: g-proteobacteria)]|nr:hypothetical protein [Halofilum sp. (in: g-proteobacteria)]